MKQQHHKDQDPAPRLAVPPALGAAWDALTTGSPLCAGAPRLLRRVAPAIEALAWAVVLLLALELALALVAHPALAQGDSVEGGNSGAIKQAGEAIFSWLSDLLKVAGGIGMLVCAALWALAGANTRRQAAAMAGLVGCGVAVLAGFLVPDFISLLEGFSNGKSG